MTTFVETCLNPKKFLELHTSTLIMEAAGFSEALISAHETTPWYNPEDHYLNTENNHSSKLIIHNHLPIRRVIK
jgi:hypothetical protein